MLCTVLEPVIHIQMVFTEGLILRNFVPKIERNQRIIIPDKGLSITHFKEMRVFQVKCVKGLH